MSAILEQPDDAGAFHPVALESRKPTQRERSCPPNLLEHRAVHIPGRGTNPADFLTRKRLPDGPGPAPHTGHAEPGSPLELLAASGAASGFMAAGPSAGSPCFLPADFASAIRAAPPSDPVLGPLAAAAAGAGPQPPASASPSRRGFARRDGRLCLSPRVYRLCFPGALQTQVLHELHATPLVGQFGRDSTLALARRSVWWPGLPAAVEKCVRTCQTCKRVKADPACRRPACCTLSPFTRMGKKNCRL